MGVRGPLGIVGPKSRNYLQSQALCQLGGLGGPTGIEAPQPNCLRVRQLCQSGGLGGLWPSGLGRRRRRSVYRPEQMIIILVCARIDAGRPPRLPRPPDDDPLHRYGLCAARVYVDLDPLPCSGSIWT